MSWLVLVLTLRGLKSHTIDVRIRDFRDKGCQLKIGIFVRSLPTLLLTMTKNKKITGYGYGQKKEIV